MVPNVLREITTIDETRIPVISSKPIQIVRPLYKDNYTNGLAGNNIAVWNSHGAYFESKLDRWEWQRARLFGTVEDSYTMSFVLPYLVPMLENSGASVFLPRERDIQNQMVVVDNDHSTSGSELLFSSDVKPEKVPQGFLLRDTLFTGENPFLMGSSVKVKKTETKGSVRFIPSFKEKGEYSVSVCWQPDDNNSSQVKYTVYHSGGESSFLVNQKIGGRTWIYLGTFHFKEGKHPESGMVTIDCSGPASENVSVDAVKFGGGMGNVARIAAIEMIPNTRSAIDAAKTPNKLIENEPARFTYQLSGKPKYLEGARYYLQAAGFPDTLVYTPNKNKNDYIDDYQSRGLWVNYLFGQQKDFKGGASTKGLNIPIDLSFAFHTDAGVTPNDSVIGTLGIYSSNSNQGIYPNGKSRMAARDLTDIVQSQIVEDIRELYNPKWTRRGLWDKQYSESWRPNVPAMLLELLSHQNLADMKYGLDPRFRFDVSRAIYKGMLKFLAYQEGRPYVVQPLPVDHFSIVKSGNREVKLSWRPRVDPLEPTASPLYYKVYKRMDDNGFDNGTIVNDTSWIFKVDQTDRIYSFKVTALNNGGESFAGEILCAGLKDNSKGDILVVNAFDRVCAPSVFDDGKLAGLSYWNDHGVPDKQEINFTGNQYDFSRQSEWLDDDSPGWGASYGDMETKVIPGNTFDNPFIHGKAIMASGYSFVSASNASFTSPQFDLSTYSATDIILGEERSTPNLKNPGINDFRIYTPEFQAKIAGFTNSGGKLLISGSYIGSEFGESKDTLTAKFVKNNLHFTWRTGHATKGGQVMSTNYVKDYFNGSFSFNTRYLSDIYEVESPDGIEPSGSKAYTAFRYAENNVSAGVIYYNGKSKIVALGFPFETIITVQNRHLIMQQILNFFELK